MTDNRVLVNEFPPFYPESKLEDDGWKMEIFSSDYRKLRIAGTPSDQVFLCETSLDISGYTQLEDKTVFFRNSFEQKAGPYAGTWTYGSATEVIPFRGYANLIYETVIVSSVPLTDDNLFLAVQNAPGFIQNSGFANLLNMDPGTFNRSQIVHGSSRVWGVSTLFGSDPLQGTEDETGGSILEVVDESIFSSLEPTTADTLYCYRILSLPQSFVGTYTRFNSILIPSRRVILSSQIEEEPFLEYMMRLKRSYELANQV